MLLKRQEEEEEDEEEEEEEEREEEDRRGPREGFFFSNSLGYRFLFLLLLPPADGSSLLPFASLPALASFDVTTR